MSHSQLLAYKKSVAVRTLFLSILFCWGASLVCQASRPKHVRIKKTIVTEIALNVAAGVAGRWLWQFCEKTLKEDAQRKAQVDSQKEGTPLEKLKELSRLAQQGMVLDQNTRLPGGRREVLTEKQTANDNGEELTDTEVFLCKGGAWVGWLLVWASLIEGVRNIYCLTKIARSDGYVASTGGTADYQLTAYHDDPGAVIANVSRYRTCIKTVAQIGNQAGAAKEKKNSVRDQLSRYGVYGVTEEALTRAGTGSEDFVSLVYDAVQEHYVDTIRQRYQSGTVSCLLRAAGFTHLARDLAGFGAPKLSHG